MRNDSGTCALIVTSPLIIVPACVISVATTLVIDWEFGDPGLESAVPHFPQNLVLDWVGSLQFGQFITRGISRIDFRLASAIVYRLGWLRLTGLKLHDVAVNTFRYIQLT
jgi:hypothetical protein